jgi:hypothetical protein
MLYITEEKSSFFSIDLIRNNVRFIAVLALSSVSTVWHRSSVVGDRCIERCALTPCHYSELWRNEDVSSPQETLILPSQGPVPTVPCRLYQPSAPFAIVLQLLKLISFICSDTTGSLSLKQPHNGDCICECVYHGFNLSTFLAAIYIRVIVACSNDLGVL